MPGQLNQTALLEHLLLPGVRTDPPGVASPLHGQGIYPLLTPEGFSSYCSKWVGAPASWNLRQKASRTTSGNASEQEGRAGFRRQDQPGSGQGSGRVGGDSLADQFIRGQDTATIDPDRPAARARAVVAAEAADVHELGFAVNESSGVWHEVLRGPPAHPIDRWLTTCGWRFGSGARTDWPQHLTCLLRSASCARSACQHGARLLKQSDAKLW